METREPRLLTCEDEANSTDSGSFSHEETTQNHHVCMYLMPHELQRWKRRLKTQERLSVLLFIPALASSSTFE